MTDRTEAATNAAAWATIAGEHATTFRELPEALCITDRSRVGEYHAARRDQAERMALMWAAIAALHPTEPGPSLREKFFLGGGEGFTDVMGIHAEGQAAAMRAEADKPCTPMLCGYCGCADDPTNCLCDHDGTGSTASKVTAEASRLCTASITPPEGRVGGGVTERCVLAAGHYRPNFDAKDGPHRNRLDPDDTSDVAITWADWADGAVPHAAQPEGSSGTDPS